MKQLISLILIAGFFLPATAQTDSGRQVSKVQAITTATPMSVTMSAGDWVVLLDLLDQSTAPHSKVKTYMDYINKKVTPLVSVADSTGMLKPFSNKKKAIPKVPKGG